MQSIADERTDLSVAAQLNYLTAQNAVFRKTDGNMLAVQVGDEDFQGVYLHCSFPHTNRRIYISVRTGEHKEVGIIKALDEDFPPETAVLLEEQMDIRYFAPVITKVISIKEEFGYSYWNTETSAGHCQFTVRSGSGNVKSVTENKLLVIDVDGNRFVIENVKQLSEKEYRMVEMCI